MKKQFASIILILLVSLGKAQVIDGDTLMHARDSAIIDPSQQTIEFFQVAEKVSDPSKVRVIAKTGKTSTLQLLLLTTVATSTDHALADLDNDGKKELLIYILRIDVNPYRQPDEIWVYKNITASKYQYAGRI